MTAITTQVKDKVWKDYTKKSNSKSELKSMFLGNNPGEAYKKISVKLKKKLDEETNKKSLRPTRKTKTSSSPKKSPKKTKSSPKRIKNSPKRTISPKRSPKRSPKKKTISPKGSPKRTLRPTRK